MMITLRGGDPEFDKYMRGTFSRTQRALPVRSLNVASNRETVTFEIRPASDCRNVSWVRVWWEAIRPWTYILSLGPLWLTWALCVQNAPQQNLLWILLSGMSVTLLHVAANLLNDYFDHIRGVDRVNLRSGTRVIQKGWLAAHHMMKCAYLAIVLAILFSAPVVTSCLSVLWFVALITGVLVIEFSSSRLHIKYRAAGESILFALFGPVLTTSFAYVATGTLSWASLWLGVWTGLAAAHVYFLRALENVMVDDQSGADTWATRAGFDQAKRVAIAFGVVRVVALVLFGALSQRWELGVGTALAELICQSVLWRHLVQSTSPLSSGMRGLHALAWKSYFVMVGLFSLGTLLL